MIDIRLEWIELILGIFIFSYSTFKLYQYNKGEEDFESKLRLNTTSPLIFAGGFSYGFLSALISAVGPLNVAMLERTGHYREHFIGNFAAIGFSLSIARTPFYFITDIFPYDLVLLFILGFPIIFLGTKFGQKITAKIPVKKFQVAVFCFLLVISINSIISSILDLMS